MRVPTGIVLTAAAFTTTCLPANDLPGAAPLANTATAPAAARPVEAPAPAASAPAPEPAATPIVLVVLDGVRWQEMFVGIDPVLAGRRDVGPRTDARGLFPALYGAVDARGAVLGAPGHGTIAASGPNFVSLPGYTEIFSGRPPERCRDNDCAGATGPTLVDAFRDRAESDADVAVITSWGPIGRAATQRPWRIVLSAGREDLAGEAVLAGDPTTRALLNEGARADPRPGHGSFRPDRYTSEIALRYLAEQEPSFLFVGLGEPDEYAHQGDYAGYVASLRAADAFFGRLFATLGAMGERGRRTEVLVTANHGRASNYRDHGGGLPESARVWLFAVGEGLGARGFVDAAAPRHLADVAPTIRELVGLPAAAREEGEKPAGTPITELLPRPGMAELSRGGWSVSATRLQQPSEL